MLNYLFNKVTLLECHNSLAINLFLILIFLDIAWHGGARITPYPPPLLLNTQQTIKNKIGYKKTIYISLKFTQIIFYSLTK